MISTPLSPAATETGALDIRSTRLSFHRHTPMITEGKS